MHSVTPVVGVIDVWLTAIEWKGWLPCVFALLKVI